MAAPIAITFLRDKDHGGRAGQPKAIARKLAGFIEAAATSLDIAIYDFRLSDALAGGIVTALKGAAGRGVAVRIGHDAGKPAAGTAADFLALQADPAPVGTAVWVTGHFAGTGVQTKAIQAGSHLMHSKYVLRDAGAGTAAVWTGSTNFTDDAWTLQENNIITVASQSVAAAYRTDFDAMWPQVRLPTPAPATPAARTSTLREPTPQGWLGISRPEMEPPLTQRWSLPLRLRRTGSWWPPWCSPRIRCSRRLLPRWTAESRSAESTMPDRWIPS